MTIDTLKQAAQALRDFERVIDEHLYFDEVGTAGKLAAALEALAEQEPIARVRDAGGGIHGLDWLTSGKEGDLPIGTNLYAAPIATPEHDAQVRNAALDDDPVLCTSCNGHADPRCGCDAGMRASARANKARALKTTGGAA